MLCGYVTIVIRALSFNPTWPYSAEGLLDTIIGHYLPVMVNALSWVGETHTQMHVHTHTHKRTVLAKSVETFSYSCGE